MIGSCAPGSFQDKPGQADCIECPDGQYQPTAGNSKCMSPPAGSYATNKAGKAKKCEPGSRCRAGVRVECPPGTVQPASGAVVCISCNDESTTPPIGDKVTRWQPVHGATGLDQCKKPSECGVGQFVQAEVAYDHDRVCTECPNGYFRFVLGRFC